MTLIVVLSATGGLVLYDIYAVIKGGINNTISHLIYTNSFKYPAIPFAAGLLMGHFFL